MKSCRFLPLVAAGALGTFLSSSLSAVVLTTDFADFSLDLSPGGFGGFGDQNADYSDVDAEEQVWRIVPAVHVEGVTYMMQSSSETTPSADFGTIGFTNIAGIDDFTATLSVELFDDGFDLDFEFHETVTSSITFNFLLFIDVEAGGYTDNYVEWLDFYDDGEFDVEFQNEEDYLALEVYSEGVAEFDIDNAAELEDYLFDTDLLPEGFLWEFTDDLALALQWDLSVDNTTADGAYIEVFSYYAVPEPGTWSTLLGAVGLFWVMRRRRKARR